MSAGMKSAGKNHLWGRFLIRRDEISIAEGPRVQFHNDGNQESPFEDDRQWGERLNELL